MSNRSQRRRRALRAGGALTILAGTPFLGTGDANAAVGTFDATAAAYGFDLLIQNQSITAGIAPQVAGPVAQASLTSLPSGSAFAALPYPGDVVAGVPGLAPSLASNLPQTPSYPFLVTAGLGDGPRELNQPGISMRAETDDSDSTSHSVLGTEGIGSVSDAQVRVRDSGVAATSTARQGAISLGDQGEIGAVLSSAAVLRGSSGGVDKTSHLSITGLRLSALEFTMPPMTPAPAPIPNVPSVPQAPAPFAGMTFAAPTFGFYDGQFTVQLPGVGPQQYAVSNDAVTDAFKSAGIDITYTKPVETKWGVTGATFSLHWVVPAPPDNPAFTGPTDVTLVFGRATASVGGSGADTVGAGVDAAGADTNGVAAGAFGSTSNPTLAGVDAVGLASGGLFPATGPDAGLPVTSRNGLPVANLVPADQVQSAGNSNSLHIDQLSNLYLVLVAAGVIGVFSIPTLRLLGARTR